jgi:hypothetical protein
MSPPDCLVEDPATGLYRPRDYLQSLEARVAYLEALLQQGNPEVALDHLGSTDRRQESQDSSTSALIANASPSPPEVQTPGLNDYLARRDPSARADDQPTDLLSSQVALLCLSPTGPEPHYFGPSSAVPFSRIVSAAMGLPDGGSSSQQSTDNTSESSQLRLPSRSVGEGLSRAYFDNIHPQYPILHRPTFHVLEEDFWNAAQSGDLGSASNITLFFVPMVGVHKLL